MLKIIIAFGLLALLSISSVETLKCWFCARTQGEFGLRLRDNCRNVTCPSGTRCYVEMYKSFPRHTKSLRGCTPHRDCQRSKGAARCRVCATDFCNGEYENYYIG